MNKRTAIVALMAVFTLAICFIILGAVSTDLKAALQIDDARFGSLIMALFLTSCIVQLFIGPAVDRFGYKPVAILGFLVTSASLFILANAATFETARLACILLTITVLIQPDVVADARELMQPRIPAIVVFTRDQRRVAGTHACHIGDRVVRSRRQLADRQACVAQSRTRHPSCTRP